MCAGNPNCDCSENLCTSDITCFDGEFNNIVVPEGSDLNDVLTLLETYIDEQVDDLNNLVFTVTEPNNFGLTAGSYSYAQIFNAINTVLGTVNTSIEDHETRITALEEATVTQNIELLFAVFPRVDSTGTTLQNLDEGNLEIPAWFDVAVGTTYEMEFDLVSVGAPNDPLDSGKLAIYLGESDVYIPELSAGNPVLPLRLDDVQALNIKMTISKETNTSAYVSLVAESSITSSSSTASNENYYVSKFITIATGTGILERIEVLVKPVSGQVITLNRVIIKKLNP